MSNDVFFLGAGFSKAIDNSYPTLKNLTDEVNNNYVSVKASVKKHLHDDLSDIYKDDIEKLLTFLSSNLPYKTEVQISSDDALYKDITNKIASYFNKKMRRTDLQTCLNKSQVLIEYILRSKCTCITLNYDTLLEQLLNMFALRSQRKVDFNNLYNNPLTDLTPSVSIGFRVIGEPISIPRKNLPDVIKLHGSLNWGIVGNNNSDIVYYVSDKDENYKKSHLQTYIIPPVLDKTHSYSNQVIKPIWRRAFEKIKQADNIYIYGFSFPPTDLSVKFLFQSALSSREENNKKPNIYIINTASAVDENNDNYCKDRYEEVFKGYNPIFKYCCEDSLNKFIQSEIVKKLAEIPINISQFSDQRLIMIQNTVRDFSGLHIEILKKLKKIQDSWTEPVNQNRPNYIVNYFRQNFNDIEVNEDFRDILRDLENKKCCYIFGGELFDDEEDDINKILSKFGEDILAYTKEQEEENAN